MRMRMRNLYYAQIVQIVSRKKHKCFGLRDRCVCKNKCEQKRFNTDKPISLSIQNTRRYSVCMLYTRSVAINRFLIVRLRVHFSFIREQTHTFKKVATSRLSNVIDGSANLFLRNTLSCCMCVCACVRACACV